MARLMGFDKLSPHMCPEPVEGHGLTAHIGDQALDPVVGGDERVLAEHRALRLVIQLQVYPVDRVVVAALLRGSDEIAAKLGPRGLRRHRLGAEDRRIGGDACGQAMLLEQGQIACMGSTSQVIDHYVNGRNQGLPTSLSVAGESDAEGAIEPVRLHSVSVLDPAGNPARNLDMHDPVTV